MLKTNQIEKAVSTAVENIFGAKASQIAKDLNRIKSIADLDAEITALKDEVEGLNRQRARKQEEFDRKDREIEHKIGLEKNRQEFEIKQAKREAAVSVLEDALAAKEEAFEERMKFQHDRFIEEVKYQRSLVEQMMKRLPSAEILARIGNVPDTEKPAKK